MAASPRHHHLCVGTHCALRGIGRGSPVSAEHSAVSGHFAVLDAYIGTQFVFGGTIRRLVLRSLDQLPHIVADRREWWYECHHCSWQQIFRNSCESACTRWDCPGYENIHLRIYIYICVYIHIYIYICINIYMCVYTYLYTYIYIMWNYDCMILSSKLGLRLLQLFPRFRGTGAGDRWLHHPDFLSWNPETFEGTLW